MGSALEWVPLGFSARVPLSGADAGRHLVTPIFSTSRWWGPPLVYSDIIHGVVLLFFFGPCKQIQFLPAVDRVQISESNLWALQRPETAICPLWVQMSGRREAEGHVSASQWGLSMGGGIREDYSSSFH